MANWDQITALGPIELLDCTALNNLDWFRQGHGYLINLLCPEKGYHSDLTPAMELHIKEQVLRLRETPMGKFFERSAAAPQDLPDLQLYGIRMERAIEMSRALLRITRRDPYLVRSVVLGYTCAVSDRMRCELTDIEVAKYGEFLTRLVIGLRLPWLGTRLVGYQIGTARTDAKEWLKAIGLGPTTPIDYVQAQNRPNRAELEHIGIDVRNTGSNRNSREFLEVMIVAAATELWRCVLPQKRAACHSGMQMILDFSASSESSR